VTKFHGAVVVISIVILKRLVSASQCYIHRYLLIAATVKVKVDEGESDALSSSTLQAVEAVQVVRVDAGVGGRHEQTMRSPVTVHRLTADGRRRQSSDVVRC